MLTHDEIEKALEGEDWNAGLSFEQNLVVSSLRQAIKRARDDCKTCESEKNNLVREIRRMSMMLDAITGWGEGRPEQAESINDDAKPLAPAPAPGLHCKHCDEYKVYELAHSSVGHTHYCESCSAHYIINKE